MRDPGDVTGLWDDAWRPVKYGQDDQTYKLGMSWLNETCTTIEDWGSGSGYAAQFAPRASVLGIDGSPGRRVDVVADLRTYQSTKPDGIFMRHILEHNRDWRMVLANAVASFRKRMVLAIFTPFGEETLPIPASLVYPVPDISFRKADLLDYIGPYLDHEENLATGAMYGTEHIFYLARLVAMYPDFGEPEAEAGQAA